MEGVVREGWGCAFVSQKRFRRKKQGECNALPCRQGIKGTEDTRQSCGTRQGELAPSGKRPQCPSWHFSRCAVLAPAREKHSFMAGKKILGL